MTAPARTVFLGTGTFAVPIAQALLAAPETELIGVVTAPPRPSGRGLALRPSAVGAWADSAGIRQFTPRRLRNTDTLADVAALAPQLLVLADYGRLVPGEWLALPPHGALNVHPSLLPRHRGASPIPAAILAGDRETGVTLMRMDEGLDTGPIVAQRRVPVAGDETAPELEARLAEDGAQLLRESLAGWLGGTLVATPQPSEGATLTRPLTREQGRLDATNPALVLERQVRAYQPWPGSFLELDGDRLIVWRASIAETPPPAAGEALGTANAGALVPIGTGLGLVSGDGVLVLEDVQRAGGRRMSGAELVRGQPSWLGRGNLLDAEP